MHVADRYRVIYQTVQPAQFLRRIYRRFPVPFLSHIVPYKRGGVAQFGCKPAPFWLEHVTNNHPCSFGDEQASLGRTLSSRSPTDEYDFVFQAIHFSSIGLTFVFLELRILRCLSYPSDHYCFIL
jgi:hypothetical protein